MSLLAAFIEELKGLNVHADTLPRGVKILALKTMRLEQRGNCNCDCNCDCNCQCQCNGDCNCNCDCDCQCKCDCDCSDCDCDCSDCGGEASARENVQKINNYTMPYERSKELRARFSAVMLVLRGESLERAAKAYDLDPNSLSYWSSGFKEHGPRILQIDKIPD